MGWQRVGHNLVTEQQSIREATKPVRQGAGQGGAAGLWVHGALKTAEC